MNNRLKKICTIAFTCVRLFTGHDKEIFAQSSPLDSLSFFLIHFQQSTNESDLKKAVENVQASSADNRVNDTLISKLIQVEYLLTNVIEEDLLMNFKPFNRQIVFSFAEKLIRVSRTKLPENKGLLYASALNNLGILYSLFPDSAKFNFYIEKAFKIRKKNPCTPDWDYAESLINMAQVYLNKGNKEVALDLAGKALIITKQEGVKFQITQSKCLYFLANVYKGMFKYDLSANYYEKELAVRKNIFGEESVHYALRLYFTSDMLLYLWQFDKAFSLARLALEITKRKLGEENLQYAYCLEGVGAVYYRLAEYQKAVPYYMQSLAIKERLFGKEYIDNALSLHNLASTYFQMGDYASALPMSQRASEISKKALMQGIEYDFNYAFSINYLASIYEATGQYAEALPLLQTATAITKKSLGELDQYYPKTLNNLASLYEKMQRYDSAEYYYQKVLKIRRKVLGEANPEYAASLDNLACLYKKMGKCNIAIRLCRQGLEVRKNKFGEKSPSYAASLNSLGELYMQQGKYDTAGVLLHEALAIIKQVLGNTHPEYVKCLNSLGLLNTASGDCTKATEFFIEANDISLKHILRTCASLSEQEKLNLLNEAYRQFSYIPSLIYKNPIIAPDVLEQLYINQITLKGMVLEDQRQVLTAIRKNDDSAALKVYGQWQLNKTFLGQQFLLPVNLRLPYIDSLQQYTNYLEQQLSRSSVRYRSMHQSEIITAKGISQKLQKGQAAVEFSTFQLYNTKWKDSTIYAAIILLPGDSVGRFIPLCEERQLRDLLKSSLRGDVWSVEKLYTYGDKSSPTISKYDINNSLYNLIWKPIEKYFKNVNIIYYSPAGLLHRIAFNALSCDGIHRLIDKYQLTQVFSTRSLAYPKETISKPSSVCLWGNIEYNQKDTLQSQVKAQRKLYTAVSFSSSASDAFNARGQKNEPWKRLQGSKQEIDSLKDLFQNAGISPAILSDTDASEERFKAFDGKSPELMHIATHGFFLQQKKSKNYSGGEFAGIAFKAQENSMFRSGLVLAGGNNTWKNLEKFSGREDGILTAYEIAQMDLSNTRLAVLSACNTALGDLQGEEGVIGLQRAFKMAGVKQLVMSLWKIPDQQTTELMIQFYRNLLNGRSTAEALRSAQLTIKEKYPSPYYWAGFVLVE